jgi:hypothetical protein
VVADPYRWNLKPGTKVTLKAPKVILSAGGIGSSVLLKKSGLENPNIGKGFLLHPVTFVTGVFDQNIDMVKNEAGATVNLDYRDEGSRLNGAQFLLLTPRILIDNLLPVFPGDRKQVYKLVTQARRHSTILVGVMDHANSDNQI